MDFVSGYMGEFRFLSALGVCNSRFPIRVPKVFAGFQSDRAGLETSSRPVTTKRKQPEPVILLFYIFES